MRNDHNRIISIPIFPTPHSLHPPQNLQYQIRCLPSSSRLGVCVAMRLRPSRSIVPKNTISIVPHLLCFPSRVSSAALSTFPYLYCRCPCCPKSTTSRSSVARIQLQPYLKFPLSRISTAPPLSSSRVSVAVLIVLSSIVPCTSSSLFVCLLGSDLLLALRCSALNCLLRSDPH